MICSVVKVLVDLKRALVVENLIRLQKSILEAFLESDSLCVLTHNKYRNMETAMQLLNFDGPCLN